MYSRSGLCTPDHATLVGCLLARLADGSTPPDLNFGVLRSREAGTTGSDSGRDRGNARDSSNAAAAAAAASSPSSPPPPPSAAPLTRMGDMAPLPSTGPPPPRTRVVRWPLGAVAGRRVGRTCFTIGDSTGDMARPSTAV